MKTSRILVVAGDQHSQDSLIHMLDKPQYVVNAVIDAVGASQHVSELGAPQLALIALSDGAESGVEAARALKESADLPLIFITTIDALDSVMGYLRAYADDFVVLPLNLAELEARMQLALARVPARDYDREGLVEIDGLTIDFARSRLVVDGETVRLSPIESGLLHLLLRNAPQVVDSQTLLARVWSQASVTEDTLRVHIHRLRSKLEADAHYPQYILTERGVGYRFAKRPGQAEALAP